MTPTSTQLFPEVGSMQVTGGFISVFTDGTTNLDGAAAINGPWMTANRFGDEAGVGVKWNLCYAGTTPGSLQFANYSGGNPGGYAMVRLDPTDFANPSALPVDIVVLGVTVNISGVMYGRVTNQCRTFVYTNGNFYYGTTILAAAQNFQNIGVADTWDTNPDTGLPWTRAELLDAYFGLEATVINDNGGTHNTGQIPNDFTPHYGGTFYTDRYYICPQLNDISMDVSWDIPTPPAPTTRPRTGSGELALPPLNLEAVAAGDPIAMRDALTAIQRTMQGFAAELSAAVKRVRWVTQPYSGALYTAEGGGVWTVDEPDQIEFEYARIGDILFMQIVIDGSSTAMGGTFTSLYIQMPGGYRVQASVFQTGMCVIGEVGGDEEAGIVEVDGLEGSAQPVDKLRIRRLPLGTAFTDGLAGTLSLRLTIQFRIVPPPAAQ